MADVPIMSRRASTKRISDEIRASSRGGQVEVVTVIYAAALSTVAFGWQLWRLRAIRL
jgi:hypothetical protein